MPRLFQAVPSERLLSLIGLAVMAAMAIAVAVFKPGASIILPPCPFHALTGLWCPGCGATRMFYYLVHGEIGTAFRQNPLAFVALPFVVLALVYQSLPPQHRFELPDSVRRALARYLPWSVLVVVVLFFILRNIPYAPACLLAPGGC